MPTDTRLLPKPPQNISLTRRIRIRIPLPNLALRKTRYIQYMSIRYWEHVFCKMAARRRHLARSPTTNGAGGLGMGQRFLQGGCNAWSLGMCGVFATRGREQVVPWSARACGPGGTVGCVALDSRKRPGHGCWCDLLNSRR